MKIFTKLAFVISLLFPSFAIATITCDDDVKNVTAHSNNQVYFQTVGPTCGSVWCQLAWSDVKAIDRAYAMLLTAKQSGAKVTLEWSNISNCSTGNANNASPGFVQLTLP